MSSNEMDIFVRALQAAGQSETDARILAFLITHGVSSASDIVKGCDLSKGTVYPSLQKLRDYGFVTETETRPARYQVSNQLIENIKTEVRGLSTFIIKRMDEIKLPETREVVENVRNIFEASNFTLEQPTRREHPRVARDSSYLDLPYDYIAHREFSIGIVFLDRAEIKRFKLLEGEIGVYRMFRIVERRNEEYQLVTTFLFIHADPSNISQIKGNLNQFRKESLELSAKTPWHVFFTNEKNLEDQVRRTITGMHNQKVIVDEMVGKIREELEKIDETILASKVFSYSISKFLETHRGEERIEGIFEFIQDVLAREMRNLASFSRTYMEHAVKIYEDLDLIEKKVFLPSPPYLEDSITKLDFLFSNFHPIEYELAKLFTELEDFVEGGDLNPFIFTEPYEFEEEVVDQEKMKEISEDFVNTIKKGLPNFFRFIVGEAGVGKTKVLKHVFKKRLEEENIVVVYVDCAVKADLMDSIYNELLQEDNFPPDMRSTVRMWRKQRPETSQDVLQLLEEITHISLKLKSNGFVLILDEIENTLPYSHESPLQRPLPLRQLSEILEKKRSKNLGFLIGCRKNAFPLVEKNLGMANIEKFTYNLEEMRFENVVELIKIRYKVWSIEKRSEYDRAVVEEIIGRTNGTARGIIKYLRELYDLAQEEKKSTITSSDLQKIGEIPLFR